MAGSASMNCHVTDIADAMHPRPVVHAAVRARGRLVATSNVAPGELHIGRSQPRAVPAASLR